ncbi:MAG: hypothetical protein ACRD06_01030 [Terriglobia bacterium]
MAGPIHLISSIDNWPAAQLKTAPGELDVSGILTGGPALLIYGSIPSGTTVQINGPGGPIASGAVKSGGSLMVYDGSVMGQQVAGVRTLIPYLLHPHANSTREGNQSGLVATNDGRYFANPAVLASHLVSFTRPSYPAGEVPPQFSSARLAITIGTDGNVQDIRQVGGDRAALNACEAALHSWRFKPFSFKGQAAVVEAPVVFFFSQTGKVTSPVFSELAR